MLALASTGVWAQANPSRTPLLFDERFLAEIESKGGAREEIRQREREKALRDTQEKSVDARLPGAEAEPLHRLPDNETPCFKIDRIELGGETSERFQWLLGEVAGEARDDQPIGRCLGTQGVNLVMARLQQALIAKGWVRVATHNTSRRPIERC